jgi:hypothetical protein
MGAEHQAWSFVPAFTSYFRIVISEFQASTRFDDPVWSSQVVPLAPVSCY